MHKNIIYYSIILLLLFTNIASAQVFPVQATPQLVPPYSLKLSEYSTSFSDKLFLNLLLTDITESNRQVRLKLFIESNSGGLAIQSNDVVIGANPIFLDGGVPLRLSNVDLQPYFSLENLRGISPQQYSRPLPEGVYSFCFEVFDAISGRQISRKSCARVFLALSNPPFLIQPINGELVSVKDPQNIFFSWSPSTPGGTRVEYEFTLAELWDTQIDPQAAFLASRPLHQTTTFNNVVLYGPAETQLLPNKKYGWRVRATATDGISETSVFKNNGYSEIFYFTYTDACKEPELVLGVSQGPTSQKITWQGIDHNRYHIQYRKKDAENAVWFETSTINEFTTIYNLEPGTTYEFRVGGECTENTGYTYSQVYEFTTTIVASDEPTYNCGITPEIVITNQELLPTLGVNEVFTAGDFPVTVKELAFGSGTASTGGTYTGWGFIVVPYLEDTKLKVNFEGIQINTDYQLIEGVVYTDYDQNWGGVNDVGDELQTLESENIGQAILQILLNFTGSPEQIAELEQHNESQKTETEQLLSDPYVSEEVKEELRLNNNLYETASDNLIADASENGPNPDGYSTDREMMAQTMLNKTLEVARDESFVGEAYTSLSIDPSFKGTFEKLKKIVEYFKKTAENCKEQGWGSYKNQGIVPYCIWKDTNIPQDLYYSEVDLPYSSGIIDGLYLEGEGLVQLPKFLYQAGSGIQDFIFAYTLAYISCDPFTSKMNEKRLGQLLEKLEEEEKQEEGIWNWVKTQWYSTQDYVSIYKSGKCNEAAQLRKDIDQLSEYISEIDNIQKLLESLETHLSTYFSNIKEQNNIGRYEEGKITVVVGSLFVSVGGLIITKIGRIKKILQKMTTFTKGQWDEFFEEVGKRLNKTGGNVNAGNKFKQVTKAIVKQELPRDFVNALKKMDFTEDEILEYFVIYHNDHDFRFFNEIESLMKQYPDLTKTDVNSLWGYTTHLFYGRINSWLRVGEFPTKTEAMSKLLDNAIKKLSKHNGTAFRAIELRGDALKGFLAKHQKGKKVTYNEFTSAGSTKEAAFFDKSEKNIKLIMEVKDAPDISPFADGIKFRGYKPKELILPRGSEFVVENYVVKDGIHYINIKQL